MQDSITLMFLVATALMVAAPVHAQQKEAPPVVNAELAQTGAKLWSAKACMSCHTIGKGKVIAPDLAGLFERRTVEWVKTWLKEPEPMFESDDAVKAMVNEYNGLKMPDMKLSAEEIEALMHYIAEQQPVRPDN
ncbi:MAG: c-type cytochrome [Gemmatimonadota bacterium]